MRVVLRLLLCTASVPTSCFAQDLQTVRQDTTFPVSLHGTIRSASAKVGDRVEFRTLEPVLLGNKIVAPYNATLIGEVESVRMKSSSSEESAVAIRVHTLRWDNYEHEVNLVVAGVYYSRPATLNGFPNGPQMTFLEGVQIVAHLTGEAFTEFSSRKKEVVLRNGILLLLRQVDPDNYRTLLRDQTLAARR
jgi:hypothetical protein